MVEIVVYLSLLFELVFYLGVCMFGAVMVWLHVFAWSDCLSKLGWFELVYLTVVVGFRIYCAFACWNFDLLLLVVLFVNVLFVLFVLVSGYL